MLAFVTDDGSDLEEELDRIYGLPAGEFVAARNHSLEQQCSRLSREPGASWSSCHAAVTPAAADQGYMSSTLKSISSTGMQSPLRTIS